MFSESHPALLALCIVGGGVALGIAIGTSSLWGPKLVLCFVMATNPGRCAEALVVAELIRRKPEEWRVLPHELKHDDTNIVIWRSNGAGLLHVETTLGRWRPNRIEREIIWRAVRWRCNDYLKVQMRPLLERAMDGPRITRDV